MLQPEIWLVPGVTSLYEYGFNTFDENTDPFFVVILLNKLTLYFQLKRYQVTFMVLILNKNQSMTLSTFENRFLESINVTP